MRSGLPIDHPVSERRAMRRAPLPAGVPASVQAAIVSISLAVGSGEPTNVPNRGSGGDCRDGGMRLSRRTSTMVSAHEAASS
jgi:hypothetical protein